jgi:hypothetical protein
MDSWLSGSNNHSGFAPLVLKNNVPVFLALMLHINPSLIFIRSPFLKTHLDGAIYFLADPDRYNTRI